MTLPALVADRNSRDVPCARHRKRVFCGTTRLSCRSPKADKMVYPGCGKSLVRESIGFHLAALWAPRRQPHTEESDEYQRRDAKSDRPATRFVAGHAQADRSGFQGQFAPALGGVAHVLRGAVDLPGAAG